MDVARDVAVTVGCFLIVVVLRTVDVMAGSVNVDLTVATFATTAVEVDGLRVEPTVVVLRLVDVAVDPPTVVVNVLVGNSVTHRVDVGIEDFPCAADEVIVNVEIGTVVVNVSVTSEVDVIVDAVSALPVLVSVVTSVMYAVGVVMVSVDVVTKSVTVKVLSAALDNGASKPRLTFVVDGLQRLMFDKGASRPRLAFAGGIQLSVVVRLFVANFVEVEVEVMVVGLADLLVVPPSPT